MPDGTLKVKVERHQTVKGELTFTVSLPLRCMNCGYRFKRRVQVGIDNPTITCPFCYSLNQLKLRWHLESKRLSDGATAQVILY